MIALRPCSVALARAVVAGDLSNVDAAPGWPHADTVDALRPYAEHGSGDVPGPWLVDLDGRVIGDCGWYAPPGSDGEVEIGYGIAVPYRRQGYGSAAVAALLTWVAAQPGVRRIVAETEVTNVASRAILERNGFAVLEVRSATVRYGRS